MAARRATPAAARSSTEHTRWQSSNPFGLGARWISYAHTGVTGSDWAAPGLEMVVTETLELTERALLELEIRADDTASVVLDGIDWIDVDMSQGTCVIGCIGCEPGENGLLSIWLVPGVHDLAFRVYHVGNRPRQQNESIRVAVLGAHDGGGARAGVAGAAGCWHASAAWRGLEVRSPRLGGAGTLRAGSLPA